MPDLALPHNGWLPRWHQMPLWDYLRDGGKRAIAVWHRRAGKDEVCLHFTALMAMQRPGNYVHCLPIYAQGRKTIWNAVNPHSGKRRIDEAFPLPIRTSTNESEMTLRLLNGSTWSVIGSDNYDTSLVGTSIAGLVMSEWALASPAAWAYARPVLEENDGWAIFITTPRGRNHAYDMLKYAGTAPGWFSQILTVEDTEALTKAQLAEALAESKALYGEDAGIALYQQEYHCSFQAALLGAMFAHEMAQVRREQRVREDTEAISGYPVHRAWDLGMRDDTAVWYWTGPIGGQIRVLDCHSASGSSLEYHADIVAGRCARYGWTPGTDFVPHDAKVRELGTGKTRVETMRQLGLRPMLAPDASVMDGINAVRRVLPLCVFHPRCESGLAALEQYKREWDDELKVFTPKPLHDWTADYADSFRYLAMSWRLAPARVVDAPVPEGWHIPPPDEERRGIRL